MYIFDFSANSTQELSDQRSNEQNPHHYLGDKYHDRDEKDLK